MASTDLDVLQLVTTPRSFFQQQVRVLEDEGVRCTVIEVPQPDGSREPMEYARFYGTVLRETIRPWSYDLVHVNYGLLGPIGLAQPIRPVVLTLWGSEVMSASSRLDRISRFTARHSDAVIAPSKALSRQLDCPHTLIPFGIDTNLFQPMDRDRAREHLGWDTDTRIVLFPYDPDRTVKNYSLAKRVVEQATIEAELRTVSGLDYTEMPYVMNASDALLVTSDRESGPMVVREAIACDLPIVSTDVGFVREAIDGIRHCYIGTSETDLVRGLERALETDERSNGSNYNERLGLNRMAEQLLTVYATVLCS